MKKKVKDKLINLFIILFIIGVIYAIFFVDGFKEYVDWVL